MSFANFVKKVDFEQSQFQNVGMAFSEFYLCKLPSLRVLEKCCFKAPKVSLDESFYQRSVYLC